MNKYPKIHGIWKRDEKGKLKIGEFSRDEFRVLDEIKWNFTEKIDGTNVRIMWVDGKISFAGRTDNSHLPPRLLNHLHAVYDSDASRERFNRFLGGIDACIYGEGYGAKIQKGGGNYSPYNHFIGFDVNIDGSWLEYGNARQLMHSLGFLTVPNLGTGTLYDGLDLVGKGLKSRISNVEHLAEGIVATPAVRLYDGKLDRIIVKIKPSDVAKPEEVDMKFHEGGLVNSEEIRINDISDFGLQQAIKNFREVVTSLY